MEEVEKCVEPGKLSFLGKKQGGYSWRIKLNSECR